MIIPDASTFPPRVNEVLDQFRLSNGQLREISNAMRTDFQLGLLQPHTAVAMLPTFVPALPDGSGEFLLASAFRPTFQFLFSLETGRFLAMDLSGTNLRVMLLELHGGNGPPDVLSHNFVLVPEVMTGTKEEVCISNFMMMNAFDRLF